MRIALLLPLLELRGGVRRSFNLATELRARDHEIVIVSPMGQMARTFHRLQVPMLSYREESGGLIGSLSSENRTLLTLLNEFEPDLLHVSSLLGVSIWRYLAKQLKVPVVGTVHSAEEALVINQAVWKDLAAVIAVNHDTRQAIVNSAGVSRSKCEVILPGARSITEDGLAATHKRLTSDNRPVIATFGPLNRDASRSTIVPVREHPANRSNSGRLRRVLSGDGGIDRLGSAGTEGPSGDIPVLTLLRAARKLRERGLEFQLLVVGDGDASPFLREWIELNEAGSWVLLINELYDHRDLFSAVNIVVAVNDNHDNTQFTIEAMGQGIPAVLTAKGGNFELIDDEKSGFLYPPDDPDALAQRLERLLTNEDLRLSLSREGLKLVHDRLNLDSMGDATIEMYRRCLERAGKSPEGQNKSRGRRRADSRESVLHQFVPQRDDLATKREKSMQIDDG